MLCSWVMTQFDAYMARFREQTDDPSNMAAAWWGGAEAACASLP